jgi:signal transduction histidine kinase
LNTALAQQEEIQIQNEELLKNKELIMEANKELLEKNELIQLQHNQLKDQNNNLEKLVSDRTNKLVATNKEINLFLYRASHDFQGPLATIAGLINLIKITNGVGNKAALLLEIEATIKKTNGMLVKLKTISELETTQPWHFLTADELVTALLHIIETNWPSKKIQLTVSIDKTLAFNTRTDLLLRTLELVIENAIQFANSDHPTIEIQIIQTSSWVTIKITDQGMGINPEILPFVFDMFFRGHTIAKGNGLGLYLVKKICEKMNWDVTIESQEHKFTTCQIRVPLT